MLLLSELKLPMPDDEITRIERVYEGYASDARVRRRWSPDNPGNIYIDRERDATVRALLETAGLWPPIGHPILDLGCGTGRLLRQLIGLGARRDDLVGVDLLADRLLTAVDRTQRPLLVRADGARLPFGERTFRLVVVFTVFSSILDDHVALGVAAEMDRVLESKGNVLWYDFRVRNPWNLNTRGMSRRRIASMFPGYDVDLRTLTLLPQVARRLGPLTRPAYPLLASLPFVRTHYAGLLTKP